ncbi:hypothetical protein FRC06_011824 [Ceratobasidium sp. 370]|nr:hypothetical protein FRC06_011824 [Ceratobasidium sp. 370]
MCWTLGYKGLRLILRLAVCALSFGFASVYRERLKGLEALDPYTADQDYVRYSARPSFRGLPYVVRVLNNGVHEVVQDRNAISLRRGQADEWKKLSNTSTFIATTSAAALIIPGLTYLGSPVAVNVLFIAALGVSLEGIMLTHYLMVTRDSASDKTLGILARGERPVFGAHKITVRIATFIMTLPAVYMSYSAFFLLWGLIVTVFYDPPMPSGNTRPTRFRYFLLLPVGLGLIGLLLAVFVGEAGLRYQRVQQEQREQRQGVP